MFRLFLIALLSTIFLGCSGSSSSESSERNAYLSSPKFSIGNDLVPITQSISLEFSAVMDPSSFNDETLNIKDASGTLVQSNYEQDGDSIVILTPVVYLQTNTTYTVTVGIGIKDTDERTLSKPYSFSFTTQSSGGDTTPIAIEIVKPLDVTESVNDLMNANPVDVSTKIAVQFSKDLNPLKNPSLTLEILGGGPGEGTPIAGSTELKGSVLIFTSDTGNALLPETDYEIKIADTSLVEDLYGNSFSSSSTDEWFFKTKANSTEGPTLSYSVNLSNNNLGHAELIEKSSTDGTPLDMRILFDESSDKLFLAIASSSGLEMYDIDPNTKKLTLHEIIDFDSEIKTLASDSSLLAVGTAKDGVYFYAYDSDTKSFGGLGYNDSGNMGPVYGVDAQVIGGTTYIAAVSPTTGLYIFTFASSIDFEINNVTKADFSPIDVKFVNEKLEVANFNSGVDIIGLDGTPESKIDLKGSTRHIALPGVHSYYANTLGIVYSTSHGDYKDFAGFSKDFFGYEETINGSVTNNILYSVDKDRGVESVNSSTSDRSRVTLLGGEAIVSAVVVKDPILEYSIMLVLGENNSIHTFNAIPDIDAPYLSSSIPIDGATDQSGAETVTITFSEILDLTTIKASEFSYTDELGDQVLFNLSVAISGSSTIITLIPTGFEQTCGVQSGGVGCDVTIPSTIKDLVGKSTSVKVIHFENNV